MKTKIKPTKSVKSIKSTEINWGEIAARGFITKKEWKIIGKMEMSKVGVIGKSPFTSERFWCVKFPVEQHKDKIIILNDLVNYWGNITCCLVGKLRDGALDLDKCNIDFPIYGPKMCENHGIKLTQ